MAKTKETDLVPINTGKLTKKEELLRLLPPRKVITELKDYQKECLAAIAELPEGAKALVVMPTGTGKTVTFSNIEEKGRILIISAGKEIVFNALKYYPNYDEVGVEMMQFDAKRDFPNARIISASIQTIVRRLEHYDPKEFDLIIVDEAHHSTAETYLKTINYFQPKRLIGFTATPNRTDGQGLSKVYDRICYQRDIMWAIKEGYLSDIYLRQIISQDIDLRRCHVKEDGAIGETDFKQKELVAALAKSAPFVKRVYDEYAFGQTLIYVAGVPLAREIASMIPNCLAISGDMDIRDREGILHEFLKGRVPCLVSVDALKEGVDLPNVQTLIYCRPTLSSLLYTQIVGRGLRTYPNKQYLNLIEIQGLVDEKVTLCSVPNLIGIDLSNVPKKERDGFSGKRLTEMPDYLDEINSSPEYLILSTQNAQRWADRSGYDLGGVNWYLRPDGGFELYFPAEPPNASRPDPQNGYRQQRSNDQYQMTIPAPDMLGRTMYGAIRMPVQVALDLSKIVLMTSYNAQRPLWDRNMKQKSWGKELCSQSQAWKIKQELPDVDTTNMTKAEASEIVANIKRRNGEIKCRKIYPIDIHKDPEFFEFSPECVLDEYGEERLIMDYIPNPSVFVMDADRQTIADDFTEWLIEKLKSSYERCNRDVKLLIERINEFDKTVYGSLFLGGGKQRTPKYRHLQKMDGKVISRKDLFEWFAKVADYRIAQIIDVLWVNPREVKNWNKLKVDMSSEPMSLYHVTYPESVGVLNGNRTKRLPKYAKEIKEQNQERWAAKEKEKEERKKARSRFSQ